MIRTRDFVLLFSVLAFIVVGFGVNQLGRWLDRQVAAPATVDPVAGVMSESGMILSARAPTDDTEADRAARLASLREKIAQTDISNDAGLVAIVEEEEIDEEESVEDEVIRCAGATAYQQFWDARGVTVELREGAIVVERMLETGPVVLLQLPARFVPEAAPSCLFSDVIGIANDGSLIRNDERDLYSIFGSETRIGYTLDGLPIHGTSAERGDVCGGRIVAGQYRYELSPGRDAMINCFAATPANLP